MSAKSNRRQADAREARSREAERPAVEKDEPGPAGGPPVAYAPRYDATAEGELAALAAVYRFVLDRHEAKRAAGADGGEEGAEHGTITGSSQRHAQG
jgi:hypothetical protein